jgi:hypothetical protein
MKWVGAYLLHLCSGALVVPGLTLLLMSSGFGAVHRLVGISGSPQQFYSDYSLPTAALVGLGLSYEVCETFTVKAAVWVSLPFTLMFAVRILIWEGSGSILFHGGIAGHFFTAPCQITQYAEPDFAFRCADKLFLTQLFVGTLAYSCGGFIYRIVTCRTSRPAKSACAKLS